MEWDVATSWQLRGAGAYAGFFFKRGVLKYCMQGRDAASVLKRSLSGGGGGGGGGRRRQDSDTFFLPQKRMVSFPFSGKGHPRTSPTSLTARKQAIKEKNEKNTCIFGGVWASGSPPAYGVYVAISGSTWQVKKNKQKLIQIFRSALQ